MNTNIKITPRTKDAMNGDNTQNHDQAITLYNLRKININPNNGRIPNCIYTPYVFSNSFANLDAVLPS